MSMTQAVAIEMFTSQSIQGLVSGGQWDLKAIASNVRSCASLLVTLGEEKRVSPQTVRVAAQLMATQCSRFLMGSAGTESMYTQQAHRALENAVAAFEMLEDPEKPKVEAPAKTPAEDPKIEVESSGDQPNPENKSDDPGSEETPDPEKTDETGNTPGAEGIGKESDESPTTSIPVESLIENGIPAPVVEVLIENKLNTIQEVLAYEADGNSLIPFRLIGVAIRERILTACKELVEESAAKQD